MIGNDIVDLALARKENNWKRKGFLDKIFTQNEQILIQNSENPDLKVWNLWTRKEAVYKIYNRKTGIRGYFPLEIECFDFYVSNKLEMGNVFIKNHVFFTKTEITKEFIYSLGLENANNFSKIKTLNNREFIIKINGLPYFFDSENRIKKPASISHHGRFEQIISI